MLPALSARRHGRNTSVLGTNPGRYCGSMQEATWKATCGPSIWRLLHGLGQSRPKFRQPGLHMLLAGILLAKAFGYMADTTAKPKCGFGTSGGFSPGCGHLNPTMLDPVEGKHMLQFGFPARHLFGCMVAGLVLTACRICGATTTRPMGGRN